MKLSLVIFLLQIFVLVNSTRLFSQTPKLIGPPGSRTIDLYVNQKNPSIIYASNYEGGLFMSSDYGNTVEAKEVHNKNFQINGIFHSILNNKTFLYASGYFLVNENNTNGWKLVYDDDKYSPRIKHIIVNSFNENVLYMPRYGKEIWRSDDCGENWYLLYTFDNDIDRIAIAPSDSSILYAAVGRDLYKSTDSGKNWFVPFTIPFAFDTWQLKVNPQNPHSVYSQSGGYLFNAIGSGNNVDTTVIYNLSDFIIDPTDTLVMYVAASDSWFGTGGGMKKSINGGDSWLEISNGLPYNGTTVTKLAIDPINTNNIYAGTSGQGVYKTENGGDNWDLTNLVNDGLIYNYEMINSERGEIIFLTYALHMIKTEDKGNSWKKPSFLPNENNWDLGVNSMTFNPTYKQVGYHGDGTDLFKTIDGGTSWEKVENIPGCKSVIFHKFNPDIIYAQDINNRRYISEDGGKSWTELTADFGLPVIFSSLDENIGYYSAGYEIKKTTDKGRTWNAYNEGFPLDGEGSNQGIGQIDIVDINPNILYGTTPAYYIHKGALSKSINGGESWFQVDSTLQELDPMISISSVCVDQENSNRLFVGLKHHGTPYTEIFSNGGLYLTEDECKTWKKLFDSYAYNIKIDYTTTPKTVYFTTKFGLMSLPDTAHVTSVENKNNVLPKEFVLHQNYPNPFNPTTTIKYEIPDQVRNDKNKVQTGYIQSVHLVVYDILGRETATLVNENQKPGNYEVNYNAAGLTSGIYFYKLQGDGFTQVKKMILLR